MPYHGNDTKLALWKNDKRDKPTQPLLKGGKPQLINGEEMWVSAWINAPKDASPELVQKIENLVNYLSEQNGKYPIITISLSPAGESAPAAQHATPAAPSAFPDDAGGGLSDDIPFAPLREY